MNISEMTAVELRVACRAIGINPAPLTVGGMRDTLRANALDVSRYGSSLPLGPFETLAVFRTCEEDVEGDLHLAKASDNRFYLFYEGGTFADGSEHLVFARKADAVVRAVQLTVELLDCSEDVDVSRA